MVIIHDKRLPPEYTKALKDRLPSLLLFPFGGPEERSEEKVYRSILCHPDIYFFQLDEGTLVHAPGLGEKQLRPLKEKGIKLIKGKGDPRGPYPYTARYNAARIGRSVFHNLDHTDPVIIDAAREKGLELVDVPQGYTRCSVLAVSDRAVITADRAVADAASERNMDVLLLEPGSVLLPGEERGFIGGAGGKTTDGTVILLGDLKFHPEVSKIEAFLAEHASGCVFLEGLPLYDAGGLIVFL